ncbi:MAG: nucleotidyltransferase domain-containing protein, partial [Promethearchaeota archaeon]
YPDESESIFDESILLHQENQLIHILEIFHEYENVVRVIKTNNIYSGDTLSVIMDGEAGEALAYLKSPDHWTWRMQKVEEIAEKLDSEVYGIESLYLIGSTKEGTAGPASDIDLLVHFKGTEEQKEKLIGWFNNYSKKIDEENKQRTGLKTSGLLDVHIITDEDFRKKDSWSTHITSPYMSVKRIPLKK